ncbi:hypothetical protein M0R45_031036 [Rubus argutus]|uniref:Uncharacterized protein n=1 Tax=Rubus argutus TaxID=59490 RepID=A0AAW1WH45_RUBAR
MPVTTEEPNTTAMTQTTSSSSSTLMMMIDEIYEFSAPRFFDFIKDESDEDKNKAELWFDSALTYAPSPFMPRIKTGRSVTVESMNLESSSELKVNANSLETKPQSEITPELKEETIPREAKEESRASQVKMISADKGASHDDKLEDKCTKVDGSLARGVSSNNRTDMTNEKENSNSIVQVGAGACTPKPPMNYSKKGDILSDSKKHQTATKKISSMVRNPSGLREKSRLQYSQTKNVKPSTVKREANVKNATGTPNLAQENQAIKRQKLEGGRSREILNPKPQTLPHKSKLGNTGMHSSTAIKTQKEDRKMYVREPAAPFVSMAEMMNRFQSSTRDLSLPHVNGFLSHMKPKLTLTRPKEPEFETSQRVRSVRVKSTAELEEEMMAKIPKFKARPVNKKILEAPSLPAMSRSTPQPPEFQEFHLETMARANQNAETASVASTDVSRQEELEKIPKFKAKPLNKKIFESKGDLGMFCNAKKHVTKPQEFHFATNERIPPPPPSAIHDLFDKLSLNSEPQQNPIPRKTMPNPFHLHTEERGAEKEKKFLTEVMQKQWEEERARVPKANPYPYTTDYPVIPPKPEPKECTKPEPFQLESLVRHEEEMQREMEERRKDGDGGSPDKGFQGTTNLERGPNSSSREMHRAEFDHKVKEKEMIYKRYREESEAARMVEEEKALKQLRRTLVPHARPVPRFEHPFCPQKCPKETTKAKSPNLRVLQRKERRRMMVKSATSSAAAQMR